MRVYNERDGGSVPRVQCKMQLSSARFGSEQLRLFDLVPLGKEGEMMRKKTTKKMLWWNVRRIFQVYLCTSGLKI